MMDKRDISLALTTVSVLMLTSMLLCKTCCWRTIFLGFKNIVYVKNNLYKNRTILDQTLCLLSSSMDESVQLIGADQ